MKKLLLFCFMVFLSVTAFSQAFTGTYPFTNFATTSGRIDPTPVPTATGVTFGSFSASAALPANSNAGARFSFTSQSLGATDQVNTFTGTIDLTKYYEVTVAPGSGFTIGLSKITFTFQRSGTGVRQYAVRSSLDGYATNLSASITPTNANLQVVTGNIFQSVDGPTTAQTGSTVNLTGFTGLSTSITFRFYGFNAEQAGGTFSIDDVVFAGTAAATVDVSAPTNTATFPKTNNIGITTVDLITNINEAGKSYYSVLPTTAPAPNAGQVKLGQDGAGNPALKSGSVTNAANTDATTTIAGLTAATSYNVYVVSEDNVPNLQASATVLSFTTQPAVDVTPPVFAAGYPQTDNLGSNTVYLISNINEAGRTYYVLLPTAGTAPITAAQIKAGTDGAGNPAFKSGSFINIANADATASITGLAISTGYSLYVVAQDNAPIPNLQSSFATLNITTAGPPSVIISQYYEGTGTNKWIELTNLSSTPINTASPQLKLALYGISGDAGNINLSGAPTQTYNLNITIPAKGTVMIGNSLNGNEVPYLTVAGAAAISNAVINFNGNDGVAILDANNNILDAFGQGINAKDVSYVRNLDVNTPSATFIPTDWTALTLDVVANALDSDDTNKLGVHFPPNLPPCVAPSTAPSNFASSAKTPNSVTFSFTTSSDANEYLIIRSLNNTLSASPVDGTTYTVGNSIGGGTVVGRQEDGTFTNTGLTNATTYYYFIFALNNISCTGGPKYLNTPLIGSVTTKALLACAPPSGQAQNFNTISSNHNFIQASFSPAASADQYLVVMSTNANLTALPANQTTYAVGDNLGGGIVIKSGAGTGFTRYGLIQNTKYYFFIFSVNTNCIGGPIYLTTNPLVSNYKTPILDLNKLNFYYGNLHSHSSYSDGNQDDKTKTPADDYAFAKNSMNLDFLGISEHNHSQAGMSYPNWQKGLKFAQDATTPTFLALHGMEWGVISGGGHVIVYGIDSLIGWEPNNYDIFVPKNTYTGTTGLFRIINRHGLNAVATLAHPNTTDYNNLLANYDLSADSAIVGTALESGPATSTNITYSNPGSSMSYLSYYNRMLAAGYHLGATIDHDNHNLTFGRHTKARLVVLAPALTENDILDAVKKMRFYASEDSAAKVLFTINKEAVGSIFSVAGAPQIEVTTKTTSAVSGIKIMYGQPGSGNSATSIATSATGSLTFTHAALANLQTGYYYADIVEADGSRIITSPIWYTRDDAIVKKDQHITFASTRTAIIGGPDFDAAAVSDNTSINIVYTSSNTNVATIINNDIHIVGTGTVTITASQPGNAFYNAASVAQILTIAPKPTATLAGTANVCANSTSPLVFTGTVGTPPFTFTYTLNGGASQTITSTTNVAVLNASSTVAGTYTYALTGVADAYSNQAQSGTAVLTVKSLPTASISGTTAVPANSTAPDITFTAANGTAPYTFTYSINGGTNRTVSSTGNTATVSVPTTTAGTFTYTLSGVADANCSQAQTGSASVLVRPLPVATLAGTASVCVNGIAPTVTFTGSAGTAPYTFTYTLNGGTNQTVTTNNAIATVNAPTNASGTYIYTLVSVSDAFTSQAQSGTATITVNALPVVTISSNKDLTISKGDAIVLTSTGGTQYSWTGSDIISGQNTAALTIRPKQSGSYRVVATNANGCSTTQDISITVVEDYKLEASTLVTPNGDGKNDKFIIKNIDYYPNNTLKIFDKSGRVLYTKQGYANDWEGMVNGSPLSEGTYYYILDMGSGLGNFKGFINILRD